MNKELREFLTENNINYKKITLKKGAIILDTEDSRYVIKKNKTPLENIYKYLDSRAFDYYPKLILSSSSYNVFEYIDNIDIPDDEKARDIMHIVGLLHAKTTFYKEIDDYDYKKIYEDIIDKLNYLNNYYLDIINVINREVYMSPSHYLLARNINLIFSSLDKSYFLINKWYDIIKEKKKIRLVTIHNNLDVSNYLRSDKAYLLSWDKSRVDMPIYDLLNFYQKYANVFDFESLFHYYESIYPLLEEEKILLLVLILIPSKINFEQKEYSRCKEIRKHIDYLYKGISLSDSYYSLPPPKNSTKGKENK
jgi:hypothetical protein